MHKLIQKIPTTKTIIYLCGVLPIFILFYNVPIFGDDISNNMRKQIFDTPLKDLMCVYHEYFTWSSRAIINFFVYGIESVAHNRIVFSLLTSACFLLLVHSLSRLINKTHNNTLDIVIIFFAYCIPSLGLYTAGWMTTTITYFFPVCLITYALLPLFGEPLKPGSLNWWLVALSLIFATNNEQVLVFTIVVLLGTFFINLYNKHIGINNPFLYGIICMMNLLLTLLSPGNQARNVRDIKYLFPDFRKLSLINKADMGIMSTAQHFIYGWNLPIIILLITAVIWGYRNREINKLPLIVSSVGLFIKLSLTVMFSIYRRHGNFSRLFYFPRNGLLTSPQPRLFVMFLALANILFFALIVYLLYAIQIKYKTELAVLVIAGIASRLAMALSATQYGSGSRTFFVLEAALVIYSLYIYCDWLSSNDLSSTVTWKECIIPAIFGTINIAFLFWSFTVSLKFLTFNFPLQLIVIGQ